MSGNMPKRNRDTKSSSSSHTPKPRRAGGRGRGSDPGGAESSPAPSQPATAPSTPSHPATLPAASAPVARDPYLESLLSSLDIEDDFKDSIRALSPTSQREVLNDIVRQQQQTRAATFLAGTDTAYRGANGSFDDYESGEEEEEEEEDQFADMDDQQFAEMLHHGFDEELRTARGRGQGSGARMDFMRFGGQQPGQLHGGFIGSAGEADGNPMQFLIQQVLPALFDTTTPQGRRQRGAETGEAVVHINGRPVGDNVSQRLQEMLRQQLQGLMMEADQLSAMHTMGIDRDIDDMSYEELLALEEQLGSVSKGLDTDAKMERCLSHLAEPPAEGRCPICLDEFKPSSTSSTPEKATGTGGRSSEGPTELSSRAPSVTESQSCVTLKNCGHNFHEACIKQWMRTERVCPVCKREVVPLQ